MRCAINREALSISAALFFESSIHSVSDFLFSDYYYLFVWITFVVETASMPYNKIKSNVSEIGEMLEFRVDISEYVFVLPKQRATHNAHRIKIKNVMLIVEHHIRVILEHID